MFNEKTLEFFKNLAEIESKEYEIYLQKSDHITYDIKFILNYVTKENDILDLGTGTGLVMNKIEPHVGSITCVELFEDFSNFIKKSNKIKIINSNILDFNSNKRYDVVTGFGILHYFDKQEAVKIYENSLSMIKENGLMIIKNQFGVDIDVTVDGFSNNIGRNYYSNYRQVNDEINLLKDIGFNIVEKHNIYPSELNKWYNTHYFALVCRK